MFSVIDLHDDKVECFYSAVEIQLPRCAIDAYRENGPTGDYPEAINWEGDACTQLTVKKRATPVGSKTDGSLVELVAKLSPSLTRRRGDRTHSEYEETPHASRSALDHGPGTELSRTSPYS